jgi:hypothetical protein
MSRVAMSRAALVARDARAASDAAAGAAAAVARDEADLAGQTREARITAAQRATMGSGPVVAGAPVRASERKERELAALMGDHPMGSVVRFRSYDPTLRPRSWRRDADRAAWGLRRDDELLVVGYGAATGFPEGVMVRRGSDGNDGPDILVFADELGETSARA